MFCKKTNLDIPSNTWQHVFGACFIRNDHINYSIVKVVKSR